MYLSTICYIEKDDKYLMLLRNKKKNDMNEGKYLGVGGKFEPGESPEECICREVFEETGLTLTSFVMRGVMSFSSVGYEDEYIFVFTADGYTGELTDCNEGELKWVEKDRILSLNLWEGDKTFLKMLIDGVPFFSMKVSYDKDELKEITVYTPDKKENVTGGQVPCHIIGDKK